MYIQGPLYVQEEVEGSESERFEDVMLLILKMKKGAMSQGM